jgi:protein-S-isoprenylcysteine O-methyltransferase Ste14
MSPLFSSLFEELVFWAAVICAFVVPLVLFGRWMRSGDASVKSASKDRSNLTNFALIPVAAISIALGYARIAVLPHWLFYPGLALFVLGMGFTVSAYRTLGRFFSLTVRVQTDHRVVETGPYRFIRHPGYVGVIVGFLGLGLALQSWVSVLLLLVATSSALAYRLYVEEKFMVAELGDEYVQYMRRSKRLIPYVW